MDVESVEPVPTLTSGVFNPAADKSFLSIKRFDAVDHSRDTLSSEISVLLWPLSWSPIAQERSNVIFEIRFLIFHFPQARESGRARFARSCTQALCLPGKP